MTKSIHVQANWDPEARVWVAESDDVPGLVTESETLEALAEKLRVLIPDLLEANDIRLPTEDHGIPFDIQAQRHDSAPLAAD